MKTALFALAFVLASSAHANEAQNFAQDFGLENVTSEQIDAQTSEDGVTNPGVADSPIAKPVIHSRLLITMVRRSTLPMRRWNWSSNPKSVSNRNFNLYLKFLNRS